ncbi:MAG: O-antigen ligase family protein [Allomuricauda sp.]|jgi:O-antigen ligase|uniref:O-antigen ligase family protein n=1 Tax=Allomuricauda sp. ARW1Y1 TaxID=2663843 RepID=UPI0015CD96CD|nr:O-antigen ligase family protein [Muricauda sp. ARW1Y1]NYJ28040.1 O-antigen ligase [Muricauda sp. ARW1Y1]
MTQQTEKLPILRYAILALILWNFPGFTLVYINSSLSSLLSYSSYGLILSYVILNKKTGNSYEMLWLGLSYFLISILVSSAYIADQYTFYVTVIKYFIIIWGGYEVVKNTTKKELWFFLVIGSFSILANIFLFQNPRADYGRYSGFYLDPNNAGLVCSLGLALSFSILRSLQLFGKLSFTSLGLITLSRTYMVTWLLLNVMSIRLSVKNAKMLLIGFGALVLLVTFNEFLPVKNERLEQMGALIEGGQKSNVQSLNEDSRTETWARYYEAIFSKPIFGNGYHSFFGNGAANTKWGVHNTYLMLWGEGGILPLLIFLSFLGKLFFKGHRQFKEKPYALMMLLAIALFLMTNHNFMTNEYSIFILMWISIQLQSSHSKEKFERFSLENPGSALKSSNS